MKQLVNLFNHRTFLKVCPQS